MKKQYDVMLTVTARMGVKIIVDEEAMRENHPDLDLSSAESIMRAFDVYDGELRLSDDFQPCRGATYLFDMECYADSCNDLMIDELEVTDVELSDADEQPKVQE